MTKTDLADLRFVLKNGGAIVFDDVVISGGVVQPIGGSSRDIGDVVFNFDLDAFGGDPTQGVGFIENDFGLAQTGGTGQTFDIQVFGTPFVNQLEYQDGVFQGNHSTTATVLTQVTGTTTVPEPMTIAIWSLLGIGCFAFGCLRRRDARR